MPNPKRAYTYSITTKDGKRHDTRVSNIEKYGIQSYVDAYPGATIHMRDAEGADYDIPLEHYEYARSQGFRPFTTEYPVKEGNRSRTGVETRQGPAQDVNPKAESDTGGTRVKSTEAPLTEMQKRGYMMELAASAANTRGSGDASVQRLRNQAEYMGRSIGRYGQAVEGAQRFNTRTGNFDKTYLTPQGVRTSSRGVAEMAAANSREAFDNSIEGQLRRAEERRDELERQLHARGQEIEAERKAGEQSMGLLGRLMSAGNDMARGGVGASGTVNTQTNNGRYTDERYIQLEEAIRQTDDLITTLRRQRDRENGEDIGILRTLRDEGANLLYYLDPNAQSRTARAMLSANDNPELESAQILLGQSLLSQQAHANYDTNENNRSRWTRIAVQSLPFMLDMISSNWATGAFRGGAKLATKATLRAFGKEAVEQMAKQGFKSYVKANGVRGLGRAAGNWTIKQLGNSADDFMRGAFVSNAAQTGKTALGITEQKLGGIEYNENNGKLEYEDDGTWSDAVWQGGMDAAIESMSEFSGEHWEGALKKLTSSAAGLLGLRRLSKILGAANSRSLGRINNTMQRAFRKAGINGYLGEVGEEYYGQLWRTMLGLDSAYQQNPDGTRTNLFGTGQFHGDIWGGMALSIGMMKAVGTPVSAANYLSMRHDVNKASAIAGEALTPEVWNPLRETIDNTTNDDMGAFVMNFVRDGEFTQEEKSAVMDYIERVMYLRGANLADVARSRGGELDPFNLQLGQDYMAGYGLDSDEQMQDARNVYDMRRQDLLSRIPPETLARIEQDPAAVGDIQDEQARRMAAVYLRSKSVYDGMIKRVQDDIDTRVAHAGAMIDARVNSDTGTIIPVTMKSQDANGNSRVAYIISGNVVMLDDGTGIDAGNSDESIVVRYADNGETEMVAPVAVMNVSEPVFPEQEKWEAERNIRLDYAQRLADRIEGRVSFIPGGTFVMTSQDGKQTAATIVADENGSIENENGEINLTIDGGKTIFHLPKEEIQRAQDNTNRIRAMERMQEVQVQDQAGIPVKDYELGNIQLIGADGHTIEAQIIEVGDETNGELGRYLVQTDGSVEGKAVVDWYSREELDRLSGRTQNSAENSNNGAENIPQSDNIEPQDIPSSAGTLQAGGETLQEPLQADASEQLAIERIPKDEQGQPLYEQAAPDTAWDAILEETGGDEDMARSVAASMVADKEAELKKAEKAKPKGGTTVAEKIAAERERKEAVEQAKANLATWQKIAQTPERRKQAALLEQRRAAEEAARLRREQEEKERAEREESERIRREAFNGVPDFVEDTPQDARARGYRRVNGDKVDRQEPLAAKQGKEVQVKFDDKNMPTGHAVLIDASQLQPSHINGHRNPAHFIDEAQPKERNDDASVMSARRIAANIRPEEITSSVTAYTGAPTVNTRGEVIQGNNRSAALREMWASYPEQAGKYKQYLKEHAADFGLAPEDVEAMQQPVLVNMLDVPDEDAIALGQFIAQDTESGGTERIKPKNLVQRMGSDMGVFANRLLASTDEDASFAELVDSNGADVLRWMQQKGYITPTQYNSAFGSKGNLTAEAKNDLKGVMYQGIFQNGSTTLEEMFGALPAKAQKAILATAYRDYDSPSTERLNGEIQSSIQAYYALLQDPDFAAAKNYKEARIAAEAWKRQYEMDDVTGESYLPSERYSNFALLLAAMYKGQTQTFIQNTFANIYELVQGTQEATLFEEPDNTPRTLVEAINETLSNLKKELLLNGNFIYNGQRRNNVLAGGSATGQQGRQGGDGSTASGGRDEDGTRTADRGTRVVGDSGGSGNRRGSGTIQADVASTQESSEERLTRDEALTIIADMEEHAEVAPEVELTIENWDALFGEDGRVNTPIGEVKMGENQFTKLMRQGRNGKLGMIKPTLENPDIIVEDSSEAKDGDVTERDSSYIYVKTFTKPDGSRYYYFTSVTVSKDGHEVVVSNQEKRRNVLTNLLLKGKLVWKHADDVSTASDVADGLYSSQGNNMSDPAIEGTDAPQTNNSVHKDTDKSAVTQTIGEKVAKAEKETATNPTEAQKEAGNYKKGHVRIGQFDITVENPKGSVRRGVDANGKAWEQTMRNTYGYIRSTEGVDGDHIDVFLTNDIDGWNGRRVYIVDQYNEDGTFDEHKVMLGFNDEAEAQDAYLSNYEKGWSFKHKLVLSSVNLPDFEKWINSSHRKTKPFAEYKSVNKENVTNEPNAPETGFEIAPAQYTTKRGKVLDMHLVKFDKPLTKEQQRAARELAKAEKGWYDRDKGGFMMRSKESAQKLAGTVLGSEESVADAQPLSLADTRKLEEPVMRKVDVEGLMQAIQENGEAKLSDHFVVGRPGLTEKMRTGQEEATPQSEKNDNGYGADNKLVSRERYEELKKRMRQKFGGQLNMGIDPEILAIGTEMAAYHIEAGARKFADYARHMIDDLGDAIRPYLKSFYNGARDLPELQEAGLSNEMTPYDEVRTFDVANFDKPTVNAIDTAQMVVQEQEADKQAESAKNALTERRNKQRKKEHQKKQKESKIADLFSGREGTLPKSQEVKSADTSTYNAENTGINRKFADAVKTDMLSALDSGTKPYRSILDLRKRAAGLGMEVDNDGRTDILLQELVEDGLVRAAREVAERHGSDSMETYNLICKLYEMQPTIAARSSNRIKMQQYSTPLPMAWNAVRFAMTGKKDGKVLEPTAGNGMLVFAIPAGQVHANELDGTRLANLREQGFAQVTQQDATEPFDGGKQYDVVIANPPFGKREAVDYDGKLISGLDPQITLNALASMKDDGKAAIIIGGNMEYSKNGAINNMKPFFTYLYDHYNVKGVVDMDGSLYAKQGTTYPTRMILIDGRRSDEERAQSAVYPPVQSKAIRKADSVEALYDIIDEVINSKDKTNGTEILRSQQGQLVPVTDQPSRNTDGKRHTEQPRKDDTGRLGGRTSVEGTQEPGEMVLRGEHRTDTGNGEAGRGAGGNTTGGSRGVSRTDVQRVERVGVSTERVGLDPQRTAEQPKKRGLSEEKLPYRPHNTAFSLQSVAPAAMVEAMDRTLSQIEKKHGNIDEFVRKELGYDTTVELHQALAAEQIDSVAMAIYQMKQGQALIIGDQTGVGKGRQMAALIRWAVRQGEKPIFITQKADLFSDIYRDLVDIGSGDLVPFIFNSPSAKENKGEMVDANGKVVYKGLSDAKMKKVFATGKLPDECDYAVLTYSQVNTGDEVSQKEMEEAAKKNKTRSKKSKSAKDGKATPKATFLRAIAEDNYLFLDESHTAAGSSNTGAYLQSILRSAKAATFASATFAKRPDTMPLYAIRTAMSQAKVEPDKLISIIEKGGVTLQEIMSRELTNAGQMVRRERDMSDVVTDWKTINDPETVRRARENYDRTIAAFNAIIKFQEDYVKPMVDAMDKELAVMAESAGIKRGTDKLGVENVPFASKTYNYTKQLMLALKVDAIANEVDAEIKAGRHPVIALESTMESSIKDYSAGEVIAEPTFSASLLRGLDTVMQYTIKDENGKGQHARYSPKQLGPAGEKAYYELQDFIRESTSDIFISPLDAIIERLHDMGYKVGELTGRNLYVERDSEGRVVVKRRTDKDKKRMQREFNNGDLDVLILNKSASTGISLHASEKFSDQRQRTMIIAQPLSDINDYMQMIGRIDRTGQVHRGYYINLGLPVPAENRFLMMLSTKLKSLNANTTTSQDSESNEVEAPDLLNKYGSQVVVEYLRDNPDIYDKMGRPLKKNGENGGTVSIAELDEYKPQEDDARKITGYVALLTTKEQEEFYDDVVRRYNELIKYLNDTGNNDLKITVMPLRAKTLEKRVSSEGIDPTGTNPFAQNSYVEQVEMDVLRKPMKAAEIRKTIEQVNKGKSPEDYIRQVVATIEKEDEARIAAEQARYERSKVRAQEDIAKQTEKINRQQKRTAEEKQAAIADYVKENNENVESRHSDNLVRLNTNSDLLKQRLHMFEAGKSYLMPDNLETQMFDFYTPAIFCGYKAKDSKVTASTTLAVFATLDGRRRVEVKLSDIAALRSIYKATNDNWDAARSTTLENWDSQIPTGTRKTGYIMTGNILQAIADTQDERGGFPGQLISYTDIDGNVHDGILMPDKWNRSMLKTSGAPILSRLKQIKDYMPVTSHDGKVEITGSSWAKTYYLTIPKTKKNGAVFFENKVILRAVNGGNFYPYRGKLRADIPSENIETVVKELSKLGVKVQEEANDDDVLYREADDDLSKVNERFNEELQRYQDGQMNKNDMFHLGNPYGTMRMFLRDLPIVMRQRVVNKGSNRKHDVGVMALQDMPARISEPIFVFKKNDGSVGILTEMKDRNGRNVFVAFDIATTIQDGGEYLEVNNVTTVHGRRVANIVRPILENDSLQWVDKDKALNWFSSASPDVQQEITNQELSDATKVVENFENPSVEEENLREESVSTDNESPDLFRRVIGGNSGYVGYSKSKRAVRAENAGLRNKSQMDAEFASEVNDIIASENPDQPKVTLKEIKQSLKNIKPDEWHHTSMYGNRTNYYSARTVADYFLERATQADEHEREQMLAQASERINRADDALYEHVQAHIPLESVDTQLGKRKAYKSSNGLYVEVNRSFKSVRVYAIGELAGGSYLFVDRYSDWVYDSAENRERFEEAINEANDAQQTALDGAPQELKEEVQNAKDDYERIRDSKNTDVSTREGNGALADDDLSIENDPVSKFSDKSARTARQRREFAERERQRMVQRVQELAKKLHLDNVDIVTDASTLQGRRAKAKGFFSRRTGRITIVIPNHTSVFDVEQTLLHEAVAHYGLRQLFGEHFDTFLDNVFQNADPEVRRRIVELARRRGWDFRTATEEYLASLAERTNFENIDAGWWQKIKSLFLKMLHKMGFEDFSGVTLSDNELRYILWRSYENLAEPGRYRSILGEAEDVAKQYELKVGNFAPTAAIGGQVAESANSVKAERIRKLRESKPVEITGEEYRGKYELNRDSAQKYVLDNLRGEYTIKDTGEKVNLSKVGAKKVTSHSMGNEAHLKSIAAIPQLISNAIFIEERPPYKEGAQYDSYRYYVTGLKINGEDYTVRMTIGVKNGKYYYDHYLTNIEKGNLIEIAQGFIPTEDAPNPSYADYKDKVLLSILKENEEENLLYRQGTDENMDEGDGTSPLSGPTIQAWDMIANSTKFKLTETAFDYLNAVDKFQKLIAEHSGKPVKDFENAYDALTFLSSKNREEMDMFDSFFVKPLNEAIVALTGKADSRRNWKWDRGPLRELVMYVEAKHGTERNRQMSVEAVAREGKENASSIMQAWSEAKKRINGQDGLSWTEKQAQLDESAKSLGADVAQDYSGLSSVFGNTEQYPEGWNDAARAYVTQYEDSHGQDKTSALWHAINNATGFTLQKQYETGLVSREYVERQRERFENYIPLRGFENDTAGDVYNYIGQDYYPGGNPVKTAHGRTSEPGNPFGSILNTAYASISSGNKNVAKTAFYALVMNHDTGGLAVPRRAWKVRYADLKSNPELERTVASPKLDNDEEIPEWIEAVPRIPEKGTPEEIARVLGEFESVMNKYSEEGATEPIWKKSQIAYRTLYKERDQHEIPLYIAGDKYVITITGNPRVAQAVNGLLNPNSGNENKWLEFAKKVQRFMAGAFTAKNAAFSLANLSRDTIYANNQIFIRENIRYWLRFTKNQKAGFGDYPQIMRRLYKYRSGKLDMNDKTERLFAEFMRNGGATGYTFVNTQEEYAKELEKKLRQLSKGRPDWYTPNGAVNLAFDCIEFAGQSAELVNRFAAYRTSREMGRSASRSIRDAKEITVNFNRKGAGRKTLSDKNAWYVNLAASTSEYGLDFMLFWNANMQGKYRFFQNLREHPVKTGVTMIGNSMLISAVMLPLLNNIVLPALYSMFGSGDDDGDKDRDDAANDYFNSLTDYERTRNICIRLPKGNWLKIPVSPDMAPWFTIGDAIGGQISGQRDIKASDVVHSMADAASPLSINWSYKGYARALNMLPTVTQPIAQNMMNVNFMGNPIRKAPFTTKQGKNPQYTMVYRNASPTLVELSRLSNRLTGGEDDKSSGEADWNPSMVQNLISGYTGGYGTTFLSLADWIVGTSKGEKQAVTFSKMPFVSRFAISGNKDVRLQRINSRFYEVRDFVMDFEFDRDRYLKRIAEGQKEHDSMKVAEGMTLYNDLIHSHRAAKYNRLARISGAVDAYEKYLKEFPDDEATRNLLYQIKSSGIDVLRENEEENPGARK